MPLNYKLIRSNRRTIGLQIAADAQLIVRAPLRTSEAYIDQIIQSKERWIVSTQKCAQERFAKVQPKKYEPGEEFLYLGQSYRLISVDNLPKAVVFDNDLMISSLVLGNAKDHLENWYKSQALEHITQRVEYFAQMTGLKYQSIKVNEASTRWGSCGFNDTLNFTWRLIMAPSRVVDYVVVHELMHIRQKNHSRRFWAEVASVITDYRLDERWLRENSLLLSWNSDGK